MVFDGAGALEIGEVFGEAGGTAALVGLACLEKVEAVIAVEALHEGAADDAAGDHGEDGEGDEEGGDGPEDDFGGDGPHYWSSSSASR